jgi:hypothetical protein
MKHSSPIKYRCLWRSHTRLLSHFFHLTYDLSMFRCLSPCHMISYTCISKNTQKRNSFTSGLCVTRNCFDDCKMLGFSFGWRQGGDLLHPVAEPHAFPIVLTSSPTCDKSWSIAYFSASPYPDGILINATSVTGAVYAAVGSDLNSVYATKC